MPAAEDNPLSAPVTAAAEQPACFELIQSDLVRVQQRIEELLSAGDEQIQSCLSCLNTSQGKMIRPGLVLLSGACCGSIRSEHIDLAAMAELIHRASLLHDDVIDSADVRRGKQTANRLWGNTAAVLLGDFLLSRAFYLGVSIQVDDAGRILSRTARDICTGELQQNFWTGRWDITIEQYYQLIEAKTAALFQSSCRLGAIAAAASRDAIENLSQFGRYLGIAFQIGDDLLDVVGASAAAGKTLGTDLRQGKLTLAVIHWIQQDPAKQKKRMAQLEDGCDRQTLRREMTASGSIDDALTQMQEHILHAKRYLGKLPPNPGRRSLGLLADYVAGRLA